MSGQLKDIVAIIDMDGYSVNKKFLCKELGFLTVGNAMAQSFFFDIGLRWGDLSPDGVIYHPKIEGHVNM